jgi:hypothetical protein
MKNSSAAIPVTHGRLTRSVMSFAMAMVMLGLLPGCLTARSMMAMRHRDPMDGAPRLKNSKNPRVDEVIAHLNQNTDRIESWRANSVRINADGWPLTGSIAVAKGRHLRLMVASVRGNEVDLGSNEERFWIWSREMEPGFVTCRHENMETARQQVGIPFEPDWLMQALGVERLPTDGVTMQTDPANEQVRLVEHVVSAHGQPLRRVVLVDLKKGGIVVEHGLYNYDSIPIALAKMSDHRRDKESGVVLPHRVMIEMPQNKMAMTMKFNDVQVNPRTIPSTVWELPTIRDCQLVHLDAGLPEGGIRTAVRPNVSREFEDDEPIETIRSHDDHILSRDELFREEEQTRARDEESFVEDQQDAPDESIGRAQLSSFPDDEAVEEDAEDDWSR